MNGLRPYSASDRNERLRRVCPIRVARICYLLTLTISLGKRRARSQSLQHPRDWICPTSVERIRKGGYAFPLPKGEGQGEGKQDAKKSNAARFPVDVKLLESRGKAGGFLKLL